MKRFGMLGSVACALALTGAAHAGFGFTNGDFETGNLAPWVVTPTSNGQTIFQNVELFDVTGGGASNAGHFGVGQVSFQSGVQHGIDVTQSISLVAGATYTISFDWAAFHSGPTGGNAEGGVFSVVVNGAIFGTQGAGSIDAFETIRGSISFDYVAAVSGAHDIGFRITRPFTVPGNLHQYVDNVSIVPAPGALALLGLAGLTARRRRRA